MADIELTIRIPDAHTARVVNAFTAIGGANTYTCKVRFAL